ncbi:hypothetical protein [Aphanothece sacrum]|uniref:GTP-binding protein LepA n=1 Tax=Aphanothece sacrum FPU1 TaxID=1920663 RepID=A0A401ILX7_APHSA|nr:hypothetical protein [Aphanothece sacrum]GBF82251.1 GTP-binding protein LepA [Aphanothece sacrum FPU1]GBF87211.1 GTP-binding protein LepA [Aphanothece sacrum FPU3]
MKDISTSEIYTNSPNLVDYQEQLALSLQEIKGAIEILESSQTVTDNKLEIAQKLDLANEILDQVNQRLKGLDKFGHGEVAAA